MVTLSMSAYSTVRCLFRYKRGATDRHAFFLKNNNPLSGVSTPPFVEAILPEDYR